MTTPLPFFVTIPHSGEKVPDFCSWLQGLPERTLMCDVDRFVDRLYSPTLTRLQIPWIQTEWHRYAADLNREPENVDCDSVEGASLPSGSHPRGFHWVMTTTEIPLMKKAISKKDHDQLVQQIYEPFHQSVRKQYDLLSQPHGPSENRGRDVYHLDLHSMPSLGTRQHRDPGETRADIVVSDGRGRSSRREYVDLILTSYLRAGFKVALNWPYYGGGVTERYGQPQHKQHCVQVELSRALYMDEVSKQWIPEKAATTQKKLDSALQFIVDGLKGGF